MEFPYEGAGTPEGNICCQRCSLMSKTHVSLKMYAPLLPPKRSTLSPPGTPAIAIESLGGGQNVGKTCVQLGPAMSNIHVSLSMDVPSQPPKSTSFPVPSTVAMQEPTRAEGDCAGKSLDQRAGAALYSHVSLL